VRNRSARVVLAKGSVQNVPSVARVQEVVGRVSRVLGWIGRHAQREVQRHASRVAFVVIDNQDLDEVITDVNEESVPLENLESVVDMREVNKSFSFAEVHPHVDNISIQIESRSKCILPRMAHMEALVLNWHQEVRIVVLRHPFCRDYNLKKHVD